MTGWLSCKLCALRFLEKDELWGIIIPSKNWQSIYKLLLLERLLSFSTALEFIVSLSLVALKSSLYYIMFIIIVKYMYALFIFLKWPILYLFRSNQMWIMWGSINSVSIYHAQSFMCRTQLKANYQTSQHCACVLEPCSCLHHCSIWNKDVH